MTNPLEGLTAIPSSAKGVLCRVGDNQVSAHLVIKDHLWVEIPGYKILIQVSQLHNDSKWNLEVMEWEDDINPEVASLIRVHVNENGTQIT